MLTDEEFWRIVNYLKPKYGIDMTHKKIIINGRLEVYLKNHGYATVSAFLDDMERDATGSLEASLVNLLTTNHTFFMREFEHFEFFKTVVLPELRQKEQRRKDLRIWCGASSTGEEPYTIAMVLMDFFGLEHNQWDTKVLATDISTKVLQHAVRGIYDREQLENLPQQLKRRFFKDIPGENKCRVTDELKDEVLFRQFNLMEPFPFRRQMHVIFLRNVMIYFDHQTKNELVRKLYDLLEPGGYLFIGTTETLDRGYTPFHMIKPSVFRK